MCRLFLLLLLFINLIGLDWCSSKDSIKLELLDSKFRLSIENDPDIKWVTFHVNINKEFSSYQAGELSGTAGMPQNQLWSYEFNRTLQDSDIVFIWIAVKRNRLTFRDMKDPISVEAFKSGKPFYYNKTATATATTTIATPTEENIPKKKTISLGGENKKCQPTITQLQMPRDICKDELIFEDDFNTFNQKYWKNEVRIPSTNDIEFVLYNGTAEVENGILKINANLNYLNIREDKINFGTRCTSYAFLTDCAINPTRNLYVPPITSGRINTKDYFNFKYGRVEVKARLPKGDWLFPLLSLESSFKLYGNKYKSGEMRIAFARGNNDLIWQNKNIGGDRLFGGAFFSTNATLRHDFMSNISISEVNKSEQHFGDNFHLYSLTWTQTELIMAVDNKEYGRIETNFRSQINDDGWNQGEPNAPLDQMFYITLGLSAGGHGDFPNDNKPWKNTDPAALLRFHQQLASWFFNWTQPTLEVDFVRVYAI